MNSEPTGGMIIGASKTLGNLFNGGIDEVAIYNRQLTANEIKDQYNSTWWKFNGDFWYCRQLLPQAIAKQPH